jgi:hypothetical protein
MHPEVKKALITKRTEHHWALSQRKQQDGGLLTLPRSRSPIIPKEEET